MTVSRRPTWILVLAGLVATAAIASVVRGSDPVTLRPVPEAPRRVALLIGIGDYEHFERDGKPGQSDLQGPENDVERIRKSLERFGFVGEDVRILRDSNASKAGIAEAFRWIAGRAGNREDSVVIFYSGHGSFAPDLDGDEAEIAPGDTVDEGLVPWDAADIHDPGQLVLDDEIREWLTAMPTANVTMIVDACYSGTVTRGDVGATPKGPLVPGGGGAGMDLGSTPGHTLITAASPSQLAFEEWHPATDLYFGRLTYHLTRVLDEADATMRYDDLMLRVERELTSSGSPAQFQNPQLEGERAARLFHVGGDLPRRASVTVLSSSNALEIDAGAIHGVRPSAVYDVYLPEEMEFRGDPLATIRVESVDLRTSRVIRVKGATSLPLGARAVLSRVPSGAERVHEIDVFLDRGAEGLANAVDSLEFVRITSDERTADARITRNGDGYLIWVGADSLPPQTADIDAGLTVSEPAIVYRGTRNALCRPLRRAFAISSFEAIENPVDPGWVEVRLAFTLVSENPPQDETFAPDTVVVGRQYHLWARVDGAEGQQLYLTVAIEGYTSDPSVIWPEYNAMNQPAPLNQWFRVFRRGITPDEPAGPEKLIAVAGPTQFDLHSLVQSFPSCEVSRGLGGEFQASDQPATSWQAFRHLVIIEPSDGDR